MSSDPSGRKGYRRIAPSSVPVRLHIRHHKRPQASGPWKASYLLIAGEAADARLRISENMAGAASIDQVPLENFFLDAICLDLSHKPLKSDVLIQDLETAEAAAGVAIQPNDMVLLHMDFHRRCYGRDGYLTDFPGLTRESATWLGRKKIKMFGVEAVSPGRPGHNNFEVHHVCRDMGFTHVEGLMNMEKLIGKGRFKFIGFPLKIKAGTGSPIRAVAMLDE
jgi:kynurenine formamidase